VAKGGEDIVRGRVGTGLLARSVLHWALSARGREALGGYLFIAPSLLGYLLFVAGPIIAAIVLSLFDWNILTPPKFIGIANYLRFFADERVLTVYRNTIILTIMLVCLNIVVGLAFALAVNQHLPVLISYLTRTAFFFPVLMSGAVVSVIWWYLLHFDLGVVNYYLAMIGLPRIPWLISAEWAIPSIVFLSLWKGVGFSFVVLLAGLQNVPAHLYEAAAIDGAGAFARFRFITLPLITPTIFFLIIIETIGALQVFDAPTVLTQGGPGDASRTIVMYIYENGFQFLRMGYASTLAISLFILIMIVTLIQFKFANRWVFYQ
jgi:multiple sugar transport system permease protein